MRLFRDLFRRIGVDTPQCTTEDVDSALLHGRTTSVRIVKADAGYTAKAISPPSILTTPQLWGTVNDAATAAGLCDFCVPLVHNIGRPEWSTWTQKIFFYLRRVFGQLLILSSYRAEYRGQGMG